MPALRAFKRRWNLGSDDLVFPGIVEIIVRGVWIVILLVIYFLKRDELHCPIAHKLSTFYMGTICLLGVHIVLCVVTVVLSARGTITDAAPRNHVATVLYIRLAFFLPEIVLVVLGTIWTYQGKAVCHLLLVRAAKGLVIVEWIIIVTIILFVVFVFDPLGKRHMRKRSMKDYSQVWHKRCRVLCCCVWGDENRKGAFEDISDILTKFFKFKDIVLTDVIAGMVLLHIQQKAKAKHKLEYLSASSSSTRQNKLSSTDAVESGAVNCPDILLNNGTNNINDCTDGSDGSINVAHQNVHPDHDSEDRTLQVTADEETAIRSKLKEWMTLENAEYYSKYAVGSYGAYNYVMCRNCSQRIPLCRKYRCCCQPRRFSEEKVEGDNSCECQAAAVLHYTGINPDDIIYANFENQIYETPYFLAVDDNRKSVIIAIRGTKTFQDAVTDLNAFGENFEAEGVPAGNVHGGMLKVAKNIAAHLEKIHFRESIPKDYNLVITGHSLGGGAAVILSMMYKHEFPDLKCFAYSPPGGLVSLGLQLYTEAFVCSVVIGNDIVPRLSLISMEKLKRNLFSVIKRSKAPKYKILGSGFLAMCCGWRDAVGEDLLYDDDDDDDAASIGNSRFFDVRDDSLLSSGLSRDTHPSSLAISPSTTSLKSMGDSDSESIDSQVSMRRQKDGVVEPKIRPTTYQQFHQTHVKWKKDRADRRTGLLATDPLYLPGHVLHIIEEPPINTLSKPTYVARWTKAQEFVEIACCPNMLHHHHGYVARHILQQIVRKKKFIPNSSFVVSPVVQTCPRAENTLTEIIQNGSEVINKSRSEDEADTGDVTCHDNVHDAIIDLERDDGIEISVV